MRYSVHVKTAPAVEPITRAEAKLQLRIESDIDDDHTLIDALITGAREWCENYCRRSFVRRTLELRMDCWPPEILLPRGPVLSVTHVKYVDSGGTLSTLATSAYQTDIYALPGRIVPAFGSVWPSIKPSELNAVLVEYEAGYASTETSPTDAAGNVPAAVKAAIKLIIGHLYENRELTSNTQLYEAPFAVKALLAPYEIRDFRLE